MHFNPRSSCEERPDAFGELFRAADISIHAPHARSDAALESSDFSAQISIHAPHARSDSRTARITRCARLNFNPRSSCEERPFAAVDEAGEQVHFNPRSSCEERQHPEEHRCGQVRRFQSTLLMRGATSFSAASLLQQSDFNPRSSCEERLEQAALQSDAHISIHAPHARSDQVLAIDDCLVTISIHAPHARSDPRQGLPGPPDPISIHAPHARSDRDGGFIDELATISIHAPHARSDEGTQDEVD